MPTMKLLGDTLQKRTPQFEISNQALSPLNIKQQNQPSFFEAISQYFIPNQPFSTAISRVLPSFNVSWLPCMEEPDYLDKLNSPPNVVKNSPQPHLSNKLEEMIFDKEIISPLPMHRNSLIQEEDTQQMRKPSLIPQEHVDFASRLQRASIDYTQNIFQAEDAAISKDDNL